ncbi:MAG: M6 family metalloprotease domain-containing protein, partial [ANME-2 cluster archaeon]|nr:M6 family metalloprotease domain-containing protein [ANME-2 cluster archaeon]
MRKITVSLFVFCLILIIENAAAVTASPYPFTLEQPDGYSFQARQYGDERLHWIETLDGYTIVKEEKGWWTYAAKNNEGKLIPTNNRVGMVKPLSIDIEKHVTPIWKPDDIMIRKSSPRPVKIKTLDLKANGVSGIASVTTEKVVVILINFTDVSQESTHDKTYYDNLIFNDSTDANSMFNYYREVSYDQLNITGTTGSKWYQSSHKMAYYGEDATDIDENTTRSDPNTCYIENLARETVQLADDDFNFSEYDTDSDGVVDHVIIVHAGNAQESSGVYDDIWSHQGSIWNYYSGSWHEDGEMTDDGVKVIGYTMVAESSPLGTFAHEFFHDLGAPDLYDYDTGVDEGFPVQDWDLMAGGSWANSGNTPTHMGGYLKWDIDADPTNGINGWLTPTTVSTPQTVAIDRLESSTGNRLFKVDIPETNQYFLIENRQQTGYDAYLPEAGILIWHIDEDMISYHNDIKDGWVDLNDGPPWNPYYRAWVEDPVNTSLKDGAAYSYDDGQTSFNQTTIPNSSQNNGDPTGIRIYNIGAKGSSMNVTFFNTAPTVNVISPNGGETISGNINIIWTHSDIDPTDTHTFTIKLSSDGGTTYPTIIVSGLGESLSSYVYNTTDMPDGSNYKVQVIATDNYTLPLSGNDSSDGVFTIDNHPPVLIGNPTGYPAGQTAAKNGSQITLNVSIIESGAGIKNATVNASQINASLIIPLIFEKVNDYWINQSIIVNAVDGVYYLPVTVYDNASSTNTSSVVQVIVDNTPPVVIANPIGYPDGLSAANNGTRIILNASISDTLAGVKNSTVNVSQINSSFGDIQLTNINGFWINDRVIVMAPDGTYFLNFTAYDNAYNCNDSAQVTVVIDSTMPIILSADANPSVIESNGTDNTLLNVTAIDNGSEIASVTINLSAIGGLSAQVMTNYSGVWQFITNTTSFGTFELPVNVIDNAGNSNTSITILLIANDTTLPVVIDTLPKNLATDVTIGSSITATFSEPMNSSTLNDAAIKVYSLS